MPVWGQKILRDMQSLTIRLGDLEKRVSIYVTTSRAIVQVQAEIATLKSRLNDVESAMQF